MVKVVVTTVSDLTAVRHYELCFVVLGYRKNDFYSLEREGYSDAYKLIKKCLVAFGKPVCHHWAEILLLRPQALQCEEFTRRCNTTSRSECPSTHGRYTCPKCHPSGSAT